ncbi:BolA/IbaG family iron-sulfur metabolism protein [bacterium]|nr:BolA/IbaG family iron-sulfur metabolism protein [bacterium]
MNEEELKDIISGLFQNAEVEVTDLKGTGDHWMVSVVSPEFEGKSKIEQHRMVMTPLEDRFQSNVIHAMMLKTYTPEKWAKKKGQ